MDTIQDRLKALRTSLGLSQAEFGEKIGLGKTAISKFEVGTNRISESIVLLICSTYGASREWLLSGSGSMLVSELEDPVARFAADQNLSPFVQMLISKLVSMTDAELDIVYGLVSDLYASVQASRRTESAPDPQLQGEWTDEQYRVALEEQLALEKRPKDESEAS